MQSSIKLTLALHCTDVNSTQHLFILNISEEMRTSSQDKDIFAKKRAATMLTVKKKRCGHATLLLSEMKHCKNDVV